MALSFVSYTGNGTTTSFAVPFLYLSQADVFVTVAGAAAAFTWTNPALIHFTTAPASGAGILIKRSTNIVTLDVVFTDGSTVQASDVNTDVLQALYLAQEQADNISTVIAQGAAAQAAATAATAAAAAAQAAAVPMVGDSGSGGTAGLVPAPPAGSLAAKKFLSAGGTWVAPGVGNPNPPLYLENFGGGVGATGALNVTALNAALTSLGTNSGVIQFGPGTYTFASLINFTYTGTGLQSVALLGCGQDITTLLWPTTAGVLFNLNSASKQTFHIRDLSFHCSTVNTVTGFTAINSVQGGQLRANDITRVCFSGDDGGNSSKVWATAISLKGMANTLLDTVLIASGAGTGVGLLFQGNSAGTVKFAINLNLDNCMFLNLLQGLVLGDWWQGVEITNCNFTNGGTCIGVSAGGTSGQLSQLCITNTQFGPTAGNGLFCATAVGDVSLSNNYFLVPPSFSGVQLASSNGGQVTGNNFQAVGTGASGQNGLVVGAGVAAPGPMSVVGNTFFNLSTGVNLQTSSQHVNVQSNSYLGNTNTVVNAGTGNVVGGGSS